MEVESQKIRRPTWKEQNYMPQRYLVALMSFLGMLFNYMLRININLAIVAMVVPSNSSNESVSDNNECGYQDANSTSSDDYNGEFEWDEFTQSLILGAFFWGYIWTQIPGGRLAEVLGARRVFGAAICGASLLTLLIPVTARWSYKALIGLRVLLGVSQGATFPSTHALLSCWAPPQERSFLSAMVYAGSQAGTVIGFPLTAALLDAWGWDAVFYVQGGMVLVWVMLWFIVVGDKPDQARWITQVERDYIVNSLGESKEKKSPPVPWRHALTSLPLWAILIAGVGNNWGFYTLLTDLPLYMKEMLKQDINSNALLSSMPYVGMMVFSILLSHLGDVLRRKNILSTVVVRKLANSIAHVGPAICLLSLILVECDRSATIGLLFLAVTLQGGIYTGFMVNHIDIAPNFAGTLFGITNAAATIPGWLAPMTVGALTNGNQTLGQWRKVFYIAAGIFIADALFFIIAGSGVEQDWNRLTDDLVPVLGDDKRHSKSSKHTAENQISTISDKTDARERTSDSISDEAYASYVFSTKFRGNYVNKGYSSDKY